VFYSDNGATIILKIKAQPNASKSEFAGLYGEDAIKIRLAAPAVEGAANKELIKFLSKQFKLSKSEIVFKSGQTSKIKLLELPKNDKVEKFIKELENGRESI
jgi:uncharacterized protein (TIGR00251 family)